MHAGKSQFNGVKNQFYMAEAIKIAARVLGCSKSEVYCNNQNIDFFEKKSSKKINI